MRRAGKDRGERREGGILSILGPTIRSLGVAVSSAGLEERPGCYGVFHWCAETAMREASTSGRVHALPRSPNIEKEYARSLNFVVSLYMALTNLHPFDFR